MPRIEKTVFISYRRVDAPWALAVFQSLVQNGFDVFLDFDGIASGDFGSLILENIESRAHFVVLLTPSALNRCHEPGDWMRREIEAAIRARRNLVPLMLEHFSFSSPEVARQLTGTLSGLKSYNGLSVPSGYFAEAMERLRNKYLNTPLDAVLHPTSPLAQRVAQEQRAAAEAAVASKSEDVKVLVNLVSKRPPTVNSKHTAYERKTTIHGPKAALVSDKPAELGTPAILSLVEEKWLNQANKQLQGGREEIYLGTNSRGLGPAIQFSEGRLKRIYFKVKGKAQVVASAEFTGITTYNVPEKRLDWLESDNGWNYYYGFRRLRYLPVPLLLSHLKYFTTGGTIPNDVPGPCLIQDPEESESG